jgi:hypothetical protein
MPSIDAIFATPGSRRRRDHVFVLIPARRVLEESDPDAFALDDGRLVRFVDVPARAGVNDAIGVEHGKALQDVWRAPTRRCWPRPRRRRSMPSAP